MIDFDSMVDEFREMPDFSGEGMDTLPTQKGHAAQMMTRVILDKVGLPELNDELRIHMTAAGALRFTNDEDASIDDAEAWVEKEFGSVSEGQVGAFLFILDIVDDLHKQ